MTYRELYFTEDPRITMLIEGMKPVLKIFGVPFDSTSTFRPGSRFGPNAIRQAFANIEIYSPRLDVDSESLSIEDLGNLARTADIDEMVTMVSKVCNELIKEGSPFAALGGEHLITYPIVKALSKNTSILVFDAHLDMREEFEGLSLSHATFLRRILDERSADSIIHIGTRAASRGEWKLANRLGVTTISTHTILTIDHPQKLLEDFLSTSTSIYVTLDMDVLDPAYAPGVGNPEAAGLSPHHVLEFIYTLEPKNVLGFDIMEVCPPYDNGSTAIVAAKFLTELACLVSKAKV